MASPTTSMILFALLTLCLLINLDCAVEERESKYFSRFPGHDNSPYGQESGVKGYKGNYGANGIRDVNNGFGSDSGDGVGRGVGYGSISGTAYEEPNDAHLAGSDGAAGAQRVRQEGTDASHRDASTNNMPSFENAKNQENQDARFGNRYSSHSTHYRGAVAQDESGTVYGSTPRYEQNHEFSSGNGVHSGSNNDYESTYNADSGYDRSFARNSYNPGSREYDRNAYGSNMGGGAGYEHTGSGYGEYVGGGN